MKIFSISLWCFGALFSLGGFLVLALASYSENIPIYLPSYGALLMSVGCFYMAWKEFKKPKLQGEKAPPYKVSRLELVGFFGFTAYIIYKYITEH